MHFDYDNQTQFNFTPQAPLTPDYLPAETETVTPYFVSKPMIKAYTKKGTLGRFLALPKMAGFILDSLEKSNDFTLDLHNVVRKTQTTSSEVQHDVKLLNERFTQLETRVSLINGEIGDVQNKLWPQIDSKIKSAEERNSMAHKLDIKKFNDQIASLKNSNRLLWIGLFCSVAVNAGIFYFLKF